MHKLLKLPWGMILTVTLLVLVIVGPSLAPYDPIAVDLNNALQGPSAAHLVGTDQLGRDVFSRLLTGGQTTVGISLAALVLSMIVGVPIGLFAGYLGKYVDWILMRDSCIAAIGINQRLLLILWRNFAQL